VPVPYSVVKQIGEVFDVNQRWLATGILPKKSYVSVADFIENKISPRELFSKAYDTFIGDFMDLIIQTAAESQDVREEDVDAMILDLYQPLGDPDAMLKNTSRKRLELVVMMGSKFSGKLLHRYVEAVSKPALAFVKKHKAEFNSGLKQGIEKLRRSGKK
jgi:hypothetical protein